MTATEVTTTEIKSFDWTLAQKAIQSIWDDRGELTAEAVVETAVDDMSPLHGYFTWDDTEAARKHRLNEARTLIRRVTITVSTPKGTDTAVRQWHPAFRAGSVNSPPGYMPVEAIQSDPEATDALLRTMRTRINALRREYGHLASFWDLVDELLDH